MSLNLLKYNKARFELKGNTLIYSSNIRRNDHEGLSNIFNCIEKLNQEISSFII